MGFAGGLFGAVIGGLVGGPIGAVIGGSLGAFLIGSKDNGNQEQARQQAAVKHCYGLFFQCLGKLAKADGRVSEDEAEFVRKLLHSWQFGKDVRRYMISEFNTGRDSAESFHLLVSRLNQQIDLLQTLELKVNMTEIFCLLVAVDRVAEDHEKAMLMEAAGIFNTVSVVKAFFAENSSSYQHKNARGADDPAKASALDDCYKLLGITPDASNAEVKKAYRKKAAEFHPDKVQGAGLSNDFIQLAKEQFQKISNAYETIAKARNM